MTTYFISDLHLSESDTKTRNLFVKFLQEKVTSADAVYILGDLWDIWIGDNRKSTFIQQTKEQLKSISDKAKLYIIPGNRDFLLNKKFADEINAKILADPCIIRLYGRKVLLAHGDIFCTKDKTYQRYKKFVRNPVVKFIFNLIPFRLKEKIASFIRNKSKDNYKKSINKKDIYDVEDETIKNIMKENKVSFIIHGHTHLPAIHKIQLDKYDARRVVLGSWGNSAYILKYSPTHSFILESISLY